MKLRLFIVLTIASINVYSQFPYKFGVSVGSGISNLSNNLGFKYLPSFSYELGLSYHINNNKKWHPRINLTYNKKGFVNEITAANDIVTNAVNYDNISLGSDLLFTRQKNKTQQYLLLGPKIDYRLGYNINSDNGNLNVSNDTKLLESTYNLDLLLNAGIGFLLYNRYSFELGLNRSILNKHKSRNEKQPAKLFANYLGVAFTYFL